MTEAAGDRPQDVGRPHRRAGELGPETVEILEQYRAAMRRELEGVLGELWPDAGQLELGSTVARPPLELRRDLWDLAIKIGRELGRGPGDAGVADAPAPADPTQLRPSRRAPRLTARERRSLAG